MGKIKVLLVVGTMNIGGAERVARDIGVYTDRSQFEIHYLVYEEMIGDYEADVVAAGCRVIHMPAPSSGYRQYFQSLTSLIRKEAYDVVHAHTMFSSGWAMLAARYAGVPVRIVHSHSALDNGKNLKKQLYETVMRSLILHNATDLIACGDAAGIRLYGEKAYKAKGIRIINGIDVKSFAFSEDSRNRIRTEQKIERDFVIGHVGHLAKVKNQAFLIRLLPRILEKKQNAKLLLLGDGNDREMLERLIRESGLTDRVIMTGNVRNVQDFLSAMDVFAFPSLFEGMPLSVVEVQANGLPCVLSTGVPKDVFLTDLLEPIPLTEVDQWVDAVCSAERSRPERYASELKRLGLDTGDVMLKYAELYERAERN